ncbi:MAG: DUF362 domain-containing protein, partial [Planctomycetes bacterium]|nr:DUF362 domain-containing protein [Planctomycetota bacterium]
MSGCLSRRAFLRRACQGVAMASVAGCGWRSVKDAPSTPHKVDAVTRATPPGHSIVSAAASTDAALGRLRADLDARRLTYEQVRAVVRRAILDLDDSKRRLGNVIGYGDWVVIKPNIVTCYGLPFSRYVCHGQVTDLRVVKALVEILVEQGKAKRITIAEGGADWRRLGEEGIDPRQTVDGWTVRWPEFGNLSYVDIVAEANKLKTGIADIVDLDTEAFTRLAVPGGHMAEAEYAIPNTIL